MAFRLGSYVLLNFGGVGLVCALCGVILFVDCCFGVLVLVVINSVVISFRFNEFEWFAKDC